MPAKICLLHTHTREWASQRGEFDFKIVVVVAGPHKDIETMSSSCLVYKLYCIAKFLIFKIGLRSSLYPRSHGKKVVFTHSLYCNGQSPLRSDLKCDVMAALINHDSVTNVKPVKEYYPN